MTRSLRIVPAVCVAVLALGAAPATAAVTCAYDGGTKVMSVALSANGDVARIDRQGSDIAVHPGPVACGTQPTVTNTDRIVVTDTADEVSQVQIDLSGGAFAPGFTNELGSSDEIEFEVHMSGTGIDALILLGSNGDDNWRLGAGTLGGGVNLNAVSESGPVLANDVDLAYDALEGSDVFQIMPFEGNNRVLAGGGAEFAGPVTTKLLLIGDIGDDALGGGSGSDEIIDGRGDDDLSGGAGDDRFLQGTTLQGTSLGDDTIAGGAGSDEVDYGLGATRVDLRLTGRQDTGAGGRDVLSGIENVETDASNDVVIGDGASNRLSAGSGDDLVVGGAGALDDLVGGPGTDTLSYSNAPAGVSIDLAIGFPTIQVTGGAGRDTIADFENLIGSPFGDLLAGTDGANAITGLGGADAIVARGGNDALAIRDGAGDDARCGAGSDVVTADAPGVDAIAADCESAALDARPDTQIVSGPPGLTRDATPTFGLRTTKAGSTFQCSLDGGPYATCSSPRTLARVADGAHAFRARSRDALGALDLTPAVRVFTTDATRPRITRVRFARSRLRYRLSEKAAVRVQVQRCTVGRCTTVKTLRRKGRKGANRVRIRRRDRALLTATDLAGNRSAIKGLVTRRGG